MDILGNVTDARGQSNFTTIIYSAPVIAVEKNEGQAPTAVVIALLPQEIEILLGSLEHHKIRLSLLKGKGEKPNYQPLSGSVEIIRGVQQSEKVIFDKKTGNKLVEKIQGMAVDYLDQHSGKKNEGHGE